MTQWVWRGLRTGIRTTRYPAVPETAEGVSPGLPQGGAYPAESLRALVACCPTHALTEAADGVAVDPGRCVHCYRCVRGAVPPLAWRRDYEWATANAAAPHEVQRRFGAEFNRSAHILVVDAGDCGACLHEVKQLTNPYYNMHRLGFFVTPTPRHADVLLVVGPVTDHMREPLLKAYDAMPTPKRVVAVGACALSGGVFGPSFVCDGGVADVLPVDVEVPGQPPPPLAILHGLLLAVGRAVPVAAPVEHSGSVER
ncbi:MAG: NADH:ubiquinone oxidoreductase [Gemmatimonadaceae bacterium]